MSILSQFKQSQNTDFPNVRPSLDLRFALAKKLDPRITFTRGSIGTYFGSDGLMRTAGVNEPRFDHDPITGQSLGLLIEESRQNLLTYSEDFSNAVWIKSSSTIQQNLITAPDGNTTADKLVENSSTGNKEVTQGSITFTSGTSLTFSCFVKAGERTLFRFAGTTGFFASGTNAYFNLSNGTVSSTTGGVTSASIIPYPNNWYRCVATMLPTSSGTGNVYITLVRSGTTSNYGGDGTSGIYIWGAQLELGSFPTSYIPTTASTVTRSADLASMTGTNFSSWYNQSEGSIIANCNKPYPVPSNNFLNVVGINNGISGAGRNAINAGYLTEGLFSLETYRNNTRIVALYPGSSNIRTRISGVSYNQTTDVYYIFTNNKTSSSAINRSDKQNIDFGTDMNTLNIGNSFGSATLCGTISRLTYYPIQLTNQQLINLTS